MIYNYDDNLRYHDDVKNKFGFANINAFPKNFDIKDINENLNVCDCCGDICNWHDEMFWQGEKTPPLGIQNKTETAVQSQDDEKN